MKTKNQNGGGRLDLLVAAQDAEAICEWIRSALQKEPIENTQPFAEESRIEIYFDTLPEAQIAQKALPKELPIQAAETREYQA